MAIGKRLQSLLKKKNMKVTTLSAQTSIPAQTIYAIIRRDSSNVDLDILRKVCAATEVNISYFYNKGTSTSLNIESNDIAEYVTFAVLDLPSKEPNEQHFDIATNNVVLSILENMAEEQNCSTTNVIEDILTEHIKSYVDENELAFAPENETSESSPSKETETTRDADLPYWMF